MHGDLFNIGVLFNRQYNTRQRKVSQFYFNYFPHRVFRAIFEAFSYIVFRLKTLTQSPTSICHVDRIQRLDRANK